ncbi:hypothetical protein [Derxia lacustris]|uniref:hypothetical protein n=1 Tax=Derxia lacustris TaxID=764842 RepID=UPI000A16F9FD|nr:hypothetical protein [Derxia lacustris]
MAPMDVVKEVLNIAAFVLLPYAVYRLRLRSRGQPAPPPDPRVIGLLLVGAVLLGLVAAWGVMFVGNHKGDYAALLPLLLGLAAGVGACCCLLMALLQALRILWRSWRHGE